MGTVFLALFTILLPFSATGLSGAGGREGRGLSLPGSLISRSTWLSGDPSLPRYSSGLLGSEDLTNDLRLRQALFEVVHKEVNDYFTLLQERQSSLRQLMACACPAQTFPGTFYQGNLGGSASSFGQGSPFSSEGFQSGQFSGQGSSFHSQPLNQFSGVPGQFSGLVQGKYPEVIGNHAGIQSSYYPGGGFGGPQPGNFFSGGLSPQVTQGVRPENLFSQKLGTEGTAASSTATASGSAGEGSAAASSEAASSDSSSQTKVTEVKTTTVEKMETSSNSASAAAAAVDSGRHKRSPGNFYSTAAGANRLADIFNSFRGVRAEEQAEAKSESGAPANGARSVTLGGVPFTSEFDLCSYRVPLVEQRLAQLRSAYFGVFNRHISNFYDFLEHVKTIKTFQEEIFNLQAEANTCTCPFIQNCRNQFGNGHVVRKRNTQAVSRSLVDNNYRENYFPVQNSAVNYFPFIFPWLQSFLALSKDIQSSLLFPLSVGGAQQVTVPFSFQTQSLPSTVFTWNSVQTPFGQVSRPGFSSINGVSTSYSWPWWLPSQQINFQPTSPNGGHLTVGNIPGEYSSGHWTGQGAEGNYLTGTFGNKFGGGVVVASSSQTGNNIGSSGSQHVQEEVNSERIKIIPEHIEESANVVKESISSHSGAVLTEASKQSENQNSIVQSTLSTASGALNRILSR